MGGKAQQGLLMFVKTDVRIDISHTNVHIRGEDEVDRITLSIHSN